MNLNCWKGWFLDKKAVGSCK
uniref:Uncharacterized protein n=1 Tax=Rhizophora mucronata TaxID=61149 RepID=A0A2P2NVS0_RHIMU